MQARRAVRLLVAAILMGACGCACAIEALRVVIADAPGSGTDVLARELGKALAANGAARSVRYENVPGAGGTIALTQFVSSSKGDPAALMVGGSTLAQAIARNRSAITFADVTPLARLQWDGGGDGQSRPWQGVFAAPAITRAQRDELIAAIQAATSTAAWKAWMRARGAEPAWLPGEAFGAFAQPPLR